MGKAIPGPLAGEIYANTEVLSVYTSKELKNYRYRFRCLLCEGISVIRRSSFRAKHKNNIVQCSKCRYLKKKSEAKLKHLQSLLPFTGIGPWLPSKTAMALAQKRHAAWGAR